MPLIVDPDDLNQGASTAVSDGAWGAPTGREVAITSAGTNLPVLGAGVYFEVRDHSTAVNNGLYRVNETAGTTGTVTAFKINGPAPVTAGAEAVTILGTGATPKSVFFDTNARDVYLLEQGNLDSAGVTLQALYSFIKLRWKDDATLIPHPFPMIAITPEQFEFIDDWNPFDAAEFGPYPTATEGFDWTDGGGGNDTLTDQNTVEDSWVINGFRVGDEVRVVDSEFEPDRTYTILAITGASDEVMEFATGTVSGTNTDDNTAIVRGAIRSRKLIRTGGWSEVDEAAARLLRQYPVVITLGTFEDAANDVAYFQFGDDPTDIDIATDFDFAGPVNESVLSYLADVAGPVDTPDGFGVTLDTPAAGTDRLDRADGGSFIDDGFLVGGQVTIRNAEQAANNGTFDIVGMAAGTLDLQAQGGGDPGMATETDDNAMVLDINNRNAFRPRLRIRDADPNGKTFDASDLASIGITGADDFNNRVFRFPLANATDLKVSETDANIDANSPYTQMRLRYFDQAFNREVDSATNRDFGIVIDVGTHSGVDGSFTAAGTVLTSSEGGINEFGATAFNGGTLRIHEGTDENTDFTIASHTDTTITISGGSFTATESNISYTAQRSSPVVATAEEIYEFVQRRLRQDADIDDTDQVVTGRTADELLRFVGDTLEAGQGIPTNPNGGGSGVIIEGFGANDTNRLTFFDNTGTARNFPFVAAGTITFNSNLQNDTGPAEYFMFFEYTTRTTNSDIDVVTPSGDTYDLEGTLPTLLVGDYIRVAGFAQAANNGLFIVTVVNVSGSDYTVRKIDGTNVGTAETNQTVSVDENPIDTPDAILVDNNSGVDITGTVSGPSVGFDFDYDNNVQGGRTAATDADIVIRALGEDLAAFVEVFGTITRATGLTFSVVAPLERNFSNPA